MDFDVVERKFLYFFNDVREKSVTNRLAYLDGIQSDWLKNQKNNYYIYKHSV